MLHEETMRRGGLADVLLVDPDAALSHEVLTYLSERDYAVEWVDTGEKAFNRLDSRLFDVLVAELNLRRIDGMRLMAVAKERNPDVCVVFIADHPDIALATEAMRRGAYDFQTKPLNLGKLEAVIQRGLAHQQLILAQHGLRRRLDERYGLGSLVGQSRQMVRIYDLVRQVAPMARTTLVQGEPGTGKELIAQAIHNNGPRRDEPFVKFGCAGMPERLQEIELLGHSPDASAFPRNWQGCVALADGGTLFLDEVWALPGSLQEKLLRLIEQGQYERPGDGHRIAADVHIIAASTRPLAALAETGSFDAALCQVLRTVVIDVPPLRERREDIPLLVDHAARAAHARMGTTFPGITRNGIDLLVRYDWPGNVRELTNVVEGMAAMAQGTRMLDVGDVPEHIRRDTAPEVNEIRIPTGTSMSEVERIVIEQTLKACEYNKEACARTLEIGLRTLYRKIKQYDIR
jgi:DNA-binding NtrC family response regulator